MKILLDAQLPRSLVPLLQAEGCDTLHTLDLPDGNRSSDSSISALADHQGRIVFSKDADFIQSHLLQGTPKQLLVIATGNIRNPELKTLLLPPASGKLSTRFDPSTRGLTDDHENDL